MFETGDQSPTKRMKGDKNGKLGKRDTLTPQDFVYRGKKDWMSAIGTGTEH